MSSNKSQGFQLQRRPGRRRSNDSPTSPTFQRRYGRPSDPYSTSESFSSPAIADTPTIDLSVPSPLLEVPLISPISVDEPSTPSKSFGPLRTSEEYGRPKLKYWGESTPSSTAGAGLGLTGVSTSRAIHTPESGPRTSSWSSPARELSDSVSRTTSREGYEDGQGPPTRFFSTLSVSGERGIPEDGGQQKQQAAKKSRLNLLNPMSLLARRRSSQNSPRSDENNLSVNTLHVPAIPDNFEPSIRGKIVHDFSIPRTRRINSELSPRPGMSPSPSYPRRPSETGSPAFSTGAVTSVPPTHSPMFREHFQDDRNVVQPSHTSYLHNSNLLAPSNSALPTFAKRLPVSLPDEIEKPQEESLGLKSSQRVEEKQLQEPSHPPPPPPNRTPSPVLDLPPVAMLPKHMTSTSSRFSFQIGGQGSLVQEKLLEARHKEHMSKALSKVNEPEEVEDEDMDEFGYDMDDMEEKIPGLNMDYDEDGDFDNSAIEVKNINMPSSLAQTTIPMMYMPSLDEEDDDGDFDTGDIEIKNINLPSSQQSVSTNRKTGTFQEISLQGFHFTPQLANFSPISPHQGSEPTPRDAQGFPIGLAESGEMASTYSLPIPDFSNTGSRFGETPEIYANAARQHDFDQFSSAAQPFEDADLYFDDGEFDIENVEAGEKFDESLLDDDNDAIKDIPAENTRRYREALLRNVDSQSSAFRDNDVHKTSDVDSQDEILELSTPKRVRISSNTQPSLTEDNLAAYHDALAMAATEAAANGKFDRSVSFGQISDDDVDVDSPFHDSQPNVSSSGSRYSNNFQGSAISDNDGFLYDDDIDDEAMIAAANAEVLENDDEGFYGQEFGFFARAHSKDQAEFMNGGYFTSRGSNGVKRSHSAKANFQEPSLTPITERSEWSTRNSVASLQIPGGIPGSAQSLPSPGIAQLLERDSPIVEDEMTLSALLKLRRGAFGGSSTSINSLGERHNAGSSPLAHVSGYSFPHTESLAHRMSSPTLSTTVQSMRIAESEDEEDDDDSETERPTVTQNTPHKKNASPVRQHSQDLPPSSPLGRFGGHHSRTSSGAESVSYAREKDGRWVLERRRTGDGGELELVGREYLAGARI